MNLKNIFRRAWLRVFIIILIILGVYFYWMHKQNKNNQQKTAIVGFGNIETSILASGKIDAVEKADLRFQTGGQINWINVREGDKVEKWQAIASLNQEDVKDRIKKSLLTYSNQRLDFEQTKDSYRDTSLSQEIERILAKNQNNLDMSVTDVEINDLARRFSVLYSPISGIVTQAFDQFAPVNSSSNTHWQIVNPDSLEFVAQVDESDINQIKEGVAVNILLDAFPNQSEQSVISKIDFTATTNNSGDTAFNVHIPLISRPNYRLGMNGDLKIIIEQHNNVLLVPIDAVIEDDQGKNVKIKSSQSKDIQTVNIETGLEDENFYEVLNGLQKDDQVILNN